jgi:hypothetical protein
MARFARRLLDDKLVDPDKSPKQVYDLHINIFGQIKYENFRRHWQRIRLQYINANKESIHAPYDIHPLGYDPNQRVAPGPSPVDMSPVARSPVARMSQSSNSTPSGRNVPPGKIEQFMLYVLVAYNYMFSL